MSRLRWLGARAVLLVVMAVDAAAKLAFIAIDTTLWFARRRRRWLGALAVLLMVSGAVAALGFVRRGQPWHRGIAVVNESSPTLGHCRPGPWGHVEYQRILIDPPEEQIPYQLVPPPAPRWFCGRRSRQEALQWLQSLQLTTAQQELLAGAPWEETSAGTVVAPPQSFVLELAPATRGRLYRALGTLPENEAQAQPFRLGADQLDEWLQSSRLSPDTIALVHRLLYPSGRAMLFADLSLVWPLLADDADRRELFRILGRRPSVLGQLRVPAGADVHPWAQYWSSGGRARDIEPLFQSLARSPGGGVVGLVQLLPPFARSLLNTFPLPSPTNGYAQDCHWSSLNFLRPRPVDAFGTVTGAIAEIQANYYPVVGNPKLGDVLLFCDARGGVFHSCVYVADEIVFTKNGSTPAAQWTLMLLPDVVASYEPAPPVQIQTYRNLQQ